MCAYKFHLVHTSTRFCKKHQVSWQLHVPAPLCACVNWELASRVHMAEGGFSDWTRSSRSSRSHDKGCRVSRNLESLIFCLWALSYSEIRNQLSFPFDEIAAAVYTLARKSPVTDPDFDVLKSAAESSLGIELCTQTKPQHPVVSSPAWTSVYISSANVFQPIQAWQLFPHGPTPAPHQHTFLPCSWQTKTMSNNITYGCLSFASGAYSRENWIWVTLHADEFIYIKLNRWWLWALVSIIKILFQSCHLLVGDCYLLSFHFLMGKIEFE